MLDARRGEMFARFLRERQQREYACAIADRHGEWSYAEAFDASVQLANCLLARGVVAGDVVTIVSDRCAALVVALLAASFAGARFLVLERGQNHRQYLQALPLQPRCSVIVDSAIEQTEVIPGLP